jgi:alcohol dehydrogenase class IV
METNIKALQTRQPEHPSLRRYDEIAKILIGEDYATAQDGVQWTSQLVQDLKIPGLSSFGMIKKQFSEAVEKTMKASSFKGNPIPLNENELNEILERAL